MLILILSTCKNQQKTPNIIIIFTDDQGYSDVGTFGAQGFQTPHLDDMGKVRKIFLKINIYVRITKNKLFVPVEI